MNNKFLRLCRLAIAVLAVGMLFLIGGCAPAPTAPSPMPENEEPVAPAPTPEEIEISELRELERNIVMEAEGETLHYLEQKKWADDEFSRVIREEDKFSCKQIQEFKSTYEVNAGNFNVEIDKEEKLTMLECDVYVKLDTWYDFHWFLKPLSLDFLGDHFERSEKELSWEGYLDGLKTTIVLKFPFKIDNCHAHVWSAK